jgi:hypothetical protein
MDANVNPHEMVARTGALRTGRNPGAEKTKAVSMIRRFAPDPEAALIALAACGLTDPYQPLPGIPDAGLSVVRQAGQATHGCRAGVAWHRAQRTSLCGPCRKRESATQRIRAMKEGD